MNILAIDTSCDETAAAVTHNNSVVSNVIWSQAAAHAKFGGVMPSLAQRMHEERINLVINKALGRKHKNLQGINMIAVTVGPGLSIALGVGVNKAIDLAKKHKLPIFPVNHLEAHVLSSFVKPKNNTEHTKTTIFPSFGLVVSGGNTVFLEIEKIGSYKILAETQDDALGEALDKCARMLGLGYPGGAILEKMAKEKKTNEILLPIPLVGQEKRKMFSYSGLKTSLLRLLQTEQKKDANFPNKEDIFNLAYSFQDVAFKHLTRTISYIITDSNLRTNFLLVGGGVAANTEFRKRLNVVCRKNNIKLLKPYNNRLYGDNAAMVGVCAYLKFKSQNQPLRDFYNYSKIDRNPRLKIDSPQT